MNIIGVLNRVYVLFVALLFWLIKPEASQPEASQPEVSQPEVSQPEVSQPEVSQPEAGQPEAVNVYGFTLEEGWE